MMIGEPPAAELTCIVHKLRWFATWIESTGEENEYDLNLISGAANTVEQYLGDNNDNKKACI